jgi:hypothetical protein
VSKALSTFAKGRIGVVKQCGWCGRLFHGRKHRNKHCSQACAKQAQKRKKDGGGACKICGQPTNNKWNKTCSTPENRWSNKCYREWKRITAKRDNVCVYTPPAEQDMENMIDILQRKGYTKGEVKVSYRYQLTEKGDITWIDLPPSDTSDDWRATHLGKEQQEYWIGVEQEVQEEGANLTAFQKLCHRIEDWDASA